MKKIHGLLLIIGLVALASVSIGCKTVTQADGSTVKIVDTNLVDRAAVWLRGLASDGALLAVHYDRNAESYLRLSASVFDGALLSKDVSPVTIRKSLTAIPVKELHGELAAIGINTVLTAYDAFFSAHLKGVVGENYIASTLVAAIRDGINSALGPPQAKQDDLRQIVRDEIRAALFPPRDHMPLGGQSLAIPAGPFNAQVPYVVTTEDRRFYGGTNGLMPQQSITWR